MKRNLVLSKHRSAGLCPWGTFIDFILLCELEHEDWYRARRFTETGPKGCFASERLKLLCVLILGLSQRQSKSHFSWRITRKGDFLTLWLWRDNQCQPSWYQLILVDTSWYWVDTVLHLRQCTHSPASGGWWHWHWYTQDNLLAVLKTRVTWLAI